MEEIPEALKEDFEGHQKEVEQIANPLMRKLYDSGGGGDNEYEDFDDNDL